MNDAFEREAIATLLVIVHDEIKAIERMFDNRLPGVLQSKLIQLKQAKEYLDTRIKVLNDAISEDVRA